ncbi:ATP-binding protein [Moraxella sp. Tifton1]|uniref:ATP-binding protein n=1 Tax=Moraxella oculi TaxID=2940516 RepID=UPI0020121A0D|nr:ATP-binding protein [Moraxella sp. Tifton1]MCL1623432.1 ATP-binding protein [Moraxella sp. Tifton1]
MSNTLPATQSANEIHEKALVSLINGQQLLNKSYLPMLSSCPARLMMSYPNEKINTHGDVRLFKLERIVLENKQSVLESLTAGYTALGVAGYSVFLLLNSNGIETDIYLGVRGQPKKTQGLAAGELLQKAFHGHFSGSSLKPMNDKTLGLLDGIATTKNNITPSVTAVTGVPSLSVEEREHFMQGLEKFIDAAEGREYQALILAEPVGSGQLDKIRIGYEGVATQLSPLLKQSLSFGENQSESVSLTLSQGLSESLGTSLGLTETNGTNTSETNTVTYGTNSSKTDSYSYSTSSPTTTSKAGMIAGTGIGAGIGFVLGGPLGAGLGASLGGTLGSAFNKTTSTNTSNSNTTGSSYSKSTGVTTGTSYSTAQSSTQTQTNTTSTNESLGQTGTQGTNRQITLEMTDKTIEQLLKQVDHHLERVDEARRYGGWQSAAYFIGDTSADSRSLASIFLGLMRGNNSNSEDFALTTWKNEESSKILPWLANLSHPRLSADFSSSLGIDYLTPATLVSGKEMAIQLSLPRRSTSTVSVVEAQAFGRRIQTVNGESETAEKFVNLGNIRHLWNDLPQKVALDINKLSSHVFITGSTGAGKSNTVYQILNELNRNNVSFMVIEPAKGEYKHIFGHRDDVSVFGTNPTQAQLLKINPFKFPQGIHVLEHIDRLVEIFNVCWPMYAAMPAVLKDAMLGAYELAGWDLELSTNQYGDGFFSSFVDLLAMLERVIESSAFSEEVKSNYIGSLVTRVKSLTNGLNGQIFSSDEIDNNLLFDSNVIVDLSRVGSQETKSLIMGILVMRLNEYRMSYGEMNAPLRHVTVIEEAHNILKRTSTEQSSEGANVAGKAVEMLSNSIAEMRTYGEGFIIADQSPNAVDMSAIRNTNTKIVMRLPDEADRRLVGKASAVNEEQLEEIAKLPKGVAVVYQNDWLEPVLCKVSHCDNEEKPYRYQASPTDLLDKRTFNTQLARLIFSQKLGQTEQFDLQALKKGIQKFNLPIVYKIGLLKSIKEISDTDKTSIWHDGTDLTNLFVSVLGIRKEMLQNFHKAESEHELNALHQQLLLTHIHPNNSIFEILQQDWVQTWQKSQQEKQEMIA